MNFENYCVSLKPLQSLKELKFEVVFQSIKLVDFPPSLEVFDYLQYEAKTPLMNLNSLTAFNLPANNSTSLPSLKHLRIFACFMQTRVPEFKHLVSLTIELNADRSISDLPLLEKLVVTAFYGTLTLQELPSLKMLQLLKQQIHFQSGVSGHTIIATCN